MRVAAEQSHGSFPRKHGLINRVISAVGHFLILEVDRTPKDLVDIHALLTQTDRRLSQARFAGEKGSPCHE
jgi:hypothetical protein